MTDLPVYLISDLRVLHRRAIHRSVSLQAQIAWKARKVAFILLRADDSATVYHPSGNARGFAQAALLEDGRRAAWKRYGEVQQTVGGVFAQVAK